MIGVLLVDDDALTLELHRTYLERLDGFEVVGDIACEIVGGLTAATPVYGELARDELELDARGFAHACDPRARTSRKATSS